LTEKKPQATPVDKQVDCFL